MSAIQHACCGIRTRFVNCAALIAAMACGTVAGADLRQSVQPKSAQLCTAAVARPSEQRFAQLVCIRARAIETAFGPLFGGRELDIRIEFARANAAMYPQTSMSSYDPARNTLVFRRSVLLMMTADAWYDYALDYWPYYRGDISRAKYPLIGIVDEALWNAHLHQAAHERGVRWPNEDCGTIDIARRLGCEMLVSATAELSQSPAAPFINTNRLDLLWPENLRDFERRAWTRDGREYREVRRLGGLMLLEPLVREFGAPRVFAYVAGTPFRIENNNVRLSALHYQDSARSALAW
jgi:hypothetical protein